MCFSKCSGFVLSRVAFLVTMLSAVGTLIACTPKANPRAGVRAHERAALVALPMGASVNMVGGNLHVRRVDLSIDTRIGHWPIAAVYNSADGAWRHNFDMTYDGTLFVDDTGAVFNTQALPVHDRIGGSKWVKMSASQVKTRGGLVYNFSNGVLSSVHWAGALYPRLVFDSAIVSGTRRVTDIRQCTGSSSCVDFYEINHSQARVSSVTDRANRTATFSYDAAGHLSVARDGKDTDEGLLGFRYTYNGTRLTSIQNSEGNRFTIGYEGATTKVANVQMIGEQNPTWTFGHFPKTSSVTDPLGHVTWHWFVTQGRKLTRVRQPTGEETVFGWTTVAGDPYNLALHQRPDGVTTTWTYPNENTAVEHQPTFGPTNDVVTTFAGYSSNVSNRAAPDSRPVVQQTDNVGAILERSYGANGQISWEENGEAERTTYTYNSNEHLQTITTPAGVQTTFRNHGHHGHPREIEFDGGTDDLEYDTVGNQLLSSSAATPSSAGRPGIVSRTFDHDRNLIELKLADFSGRASTYTVRSIDIAYRSDGKMLDVSRPGGGDHRFVYDALGQLDYQQEFVNGLWQTTDYEYTPDGLVSAVEGPNGMRLETLYDESRRTTWRTFFRNGVFERYVHFTYDNGRLAHKLDSTHAALEEFAYGPEGRIASITYPGDETHNFLYDARGRELLRSYTDASGNLLLGIGFQHDLANRIVGVDHGASSVVSRTIDDGQLTSEAFGNGLTRSYDYRNDTGELRESVTREPNGDRVEQTDVARDGFWFGSIDQDAVTRTWGAGAVNRTTTESFFMFSDNSAYGMRLIGDESFGTDIEYDRVGNIEGSYNNNYNSQLNRLTSGSGNTYWHDTSGFTTSRGGEGITWNAGGLPTSIGSRSFEWDADGRPVSRTIDGVLTRYRFGGTAKANAAGQYTDIDLGFAKFNVPTGQWTYRHVDFRGNVKFVTDDAGNVVLHRKYNGYGEVNNWGSGNDDRTFAQGEDLGDGLIMLGARVYDSDVARFLSPDPVFNLVNQYAYTLGNPIWLWDPDGRVAVTVATGTAIATFGGGLLGASLAAGPATPVAATTGLVLMGLGTLIVGLAEGSTGGGGASGGNGAAGGSGVGGPGGSGGGGTAGQAAGSGGGGSGSGPQTSPNSESKDIEFRSIDGSLFDLGSLAGLAFIGFS